MTVSCAVKRSSKATIVKSIEFSSSEPINNGGRNIFSREVGQKPVCSGAEEPVGGRGGDNGDSELCSLSQLAVKGSRELEAEEDYSKIGMPA